MRRSGVCALAAAFAAFAMPASGDVVFQIGSVTAAQGSTGTIEVDVENTGLSAITIGGFSFEVAANAAIDFTGAGFDTSAPYIFAGDSFDEANAYPLNTSSPGSTLSAFDISESGNGDTLGAGQTAGLGLLTFSVSPTAPAGPVSVTFSTDPADTSLSDQNGDAIAIDTFGNGTIDVTSAAPEPAAAAMLCLGLCAIGLLARRSR